MSKEFIHSKHGERLDFCDKIAHRSPDPSTKVGCIIYAPYGVSVGMGWNSFPANMKVDVSYYQNRELKYDRIVHAEMRALMAATDHAMGGRLYTTLPPCKECAKHICDAGLSEVYLRTSSMQADWVKRFPGEVQKSMQLFAECDIQVIMVD
jgi:dCMP deaminase